MHIVHALGYGILAGTAAAGATGAICGIALADYMHLRTLWILMLVAFLLCSTATFLINL